MKGVSVQLKNFHRAGQVGRLAITRKRQKAAFDDVAQLKTGNHTDVNHERHEPFR